MAKNNSGAADPNTGLLIDYKYCSGCHACEVACRQWHQYPAGAWGIKVLVKGPWKIDDVVEGKGEIDWDNVPVPTALCDLCADRTAVGKLPICVKSCEAASMYFGALEELVKKMPELGNKVALYKPL